MQLWDQAGMPSTLLEHYAQPGGPQESIEEDGDILPTEKRSALRS